MIQNNLVSASQLTTKLLDSVQRSTAKGSGDTTFMNLLTERLQEGASSDKGRLTSVQQSRTQVQRASTEVAQNEKDVKQKCSQSEDRPVKSKDGVKNRETEKVADEKPKTEDIKEEISSLESLLALLEDLLARLNVKPAMDETTAVATEAELMPTSQGVDLMALLQALLEGNTEELKTLISQSEGSPELQELMANIQKLLEKMGEEQTDLGKLLNFDLELEGANKEDLVAHLKAQCSDAIERVKEKLSELRNALNTLEEGEDDALALSHDIGTDEGAKAEAVTPEAKSESKSEKDSDKPLSAQTLELTQSKTAVEGDEAVSQNFSISAQQKPQEALAMKAAKAPLPLSEKPLTQTVTNQVMMKVKLMAGENKQEMEMHLKPENLGKLSLKIIHERGEILAKITAENEQVKGIIESNMQLLKDALEKSGLSVQSLSVSVGNGQDGAQSQDSQESKRTSSKLTGEHSKPLSVTETSYTRSQVSAVLLDQSSQIDLSA